MSTHNSAINKEPANSFYKRQLPDGCIAFHSPEGKGLFKSALDEGHLESYFSLSLQFLTQSEPAYCGLGSLCMVLNALEIDPMRLWKVCLSCREIHKT
jgi:glutathione gamma-glutamylcysteinyltransferase